MRSLTFTQRLLLRRFQRLPKSWKLITVVGLLLCTIFYGYLFSALFTNPLSRESFLGIKTCPACYGRSKCFDFKDGLVWATSWGHLPPFSFMNVRNLHYGRYKDRMVVLKKLSHDSELSSIDERICHRAKMPPGCNVAEAIRRSSTISGTSWIISHTKEMSDITACPTERLLDRIMDKYQEKIDAIQLSGVEKMFLITTLMVNPEPIVLQTFPHSEGWPFPEYLGACGRIVMESHAGTPLIEFQMAPFSERVKLGYQLLDIAEMFTDNDSEFALYWTDVSYDNIFVDNSGQVKIVDAENIVVVDQWNIKKEAKTGWDTPYYLEFDECEPSHDGLCLRYSRENLCQSHISDLNYYTVCRGILSRYAWGIGFRGGLLHDIPADIREKSEIENLLDECVKPTKPDGRITAKERLIVILRNLARSL